MVEVQAFTLKNSSHSSKGLEAVVMYITKQTQRQYQDRHDLTVTYMIKLNRDN